jgi:hypothetical protein
MFQGFKTTFTKEEFEFRYQEAKDKLERVYLDLQSLSTNGILQILYNIGFLGAEIDGAYVFFYNMPNLTLPQQENYVVHPAFHASLGIQERVIALNDFQRVSIKAGSNINVGGDFSVGSISQEALGDRNVVIGRSIALDQEEVLELLVRLATLFQESGLPNAQVEKALVRIEAAKQEAMEDEPDKEFVAKSVQRALKVLQENQENKASVRLYAKLEDARPPILRQLSRWVGVSRSFFELKF